MKLLILGAGGHGKVVKEVAESIVDSSGKCVYEQIEFLDDKNKEAIGKIEDIEKFVGEFDHAFVGIGNNKLRGKLINRLERAGYKIPVLIHPTAYVSRSAEIRKGTVIEPKAIVKAGISVESKRKLEAREVVLGFRGDFGKSYDCVGNKRRLVRNHTDDNNITGEKKCLYQRIIA